MKNVYQIRNEKKLFYIVDSSNYKQISNSSNKKTAIFIYLYYVDDLEIYYPYIKSIPNYVDVYFDSTDKKLLSKVQERFKEKENYFYILKEQNQGRDIAALLIEFKPYYKKYEYACFLHDKRAHRDNKADDVSLWIKNIWGNLINDNGKHVSQVIDIFESNQSLGVLFPPDPIGDNFSTWYGMGWHGSYNITESLVDRLHLNCNISSSFPPIGLGTALWFKTTALEKLFDYQWDYSLFDDEKLKDVNYFSYGVERIFAFVAQDAGYDCGEISTKEYEIIEKIKIKEQTAYYFNIIGNYYPFLVLDDAKKVHGNVDRMIEFANKNMNIVLYGSGKSGKFCLGELRKNGIEPNCFCDSKMKSGEVDALSIKNIDELDNSAAVIITPLDERVQKQIVSVLIEKNIDNYHIFWE